MHRLPVLTPLSGTDKLANTDAERPYWWTIYFNIQLWFFFFFFSPTEGNGTSHGFCVVSRALQCISSPARRGTFSLTAVSATLSQPDPEKILAAVPGGNCRNILIFCKESGKGSVFIVGKGIKETSIYMEHKWKAVWSSITRAHTCSEEPFRRGVRYFFLPDIIIF